MFQVLYSPGAAKALRKIPKETAKRIVKSMDALGNVDDPKRYIKKLKGSFEVPLYSFRVGTPSYSECQRRGSRHLCY